LKEEAYLEADKLISTQPTENEGIVSVEEPQPISEEYLPVRDELEIAEGEDDIIQKEEDIENEDNTETNSE